MLRGINQTQLFYDREDRLAFLDRLSRFKAESAFELYAYALMANHTHLLIKEIKDPLADIIKKLTLSYSHWFNRKYARSGYLFQGRFRSEPIDDDAYLLTVFKYIHHNPIKIGEGINTWTSYDDYMNTSDLTDTEFMLALFADQKSKAKKLLGEFLEIPLPGDFYTLGTTKPKDMSDEEAIERIKEISGLDACNKLAVLDKANRDRILHLLKKEGFTIRQISRLTEINRGIVQKADGSGL